MKANIKNLKTTLAMLKQLIEKETRPEILMALKIARNEIDNKLITAEMRQ